MLEPARMLTAAVEAGAGSAAKEVAATSIDGHRQKAADINMKLHVNLEQH